MNRLITLRAAPAYMELPVATEEGYMQATALANHLAGAWLAANRYMSTHKVPDRVGDSLLLPPPTGAAAAPLTYSFCGKPLGVDGMSCLTHLEPGDVLAVGFWGCCMVNEKFHPATGSVFASLDWLVGLRSAAKLVGRLAPRRFVQHNEIFLEQHVCLLTGPNNWREPRRSVPALIGIRL